MAIILQGDRAKAATWIPWAKNQLQRLKIFRSVVNQIYRPAGGVGIHVRSGAGIDWIRIVAVRIAGCRNDFKQVDISPLRVGFFNDHWIDNKKQLANNEILARYVLGDGTADATISVGGGLSHIYSSAGDYDIVLYSFLREYIGDGDDDIISGAAIIHTPGKTTITINTLGYKKAFGQLTFLSFFLTIDQITVTVDGAPVEITTDPGTPNRAIQIWIPVATGGIMVAEFTYPIIAMTDPTSGLIFVRYKCLATKTKTITVT